MLLYRSEGGADPCVLREGIREGIRFLCQKRISNPALRCRGRPPQKHDPVEDEVSGTLVVHDLILCHPLHLHPNALSGDISFTRSCSILFVSDRRPYSVDGRHVVATLRTYFTPSFF